MISSSQRPLPDNTQHSQQTNIHAPGGIRTHDLSRRQAADLRLRTRGHWDRQLVGIFFLWLCDPSRVMVSSFLRFLDHTQRSATVGRIPLDEWSARRRDPYLTAHNTHNRQISMPLVVFQPTISAGERPQTYALTARPLGPATHIYIHKHFMRELWK